MRTSHKRSRLAILAVLAFGLVAGSYAVTASNTVPTTKAGDGLGAISGYTVSAIDYTLDATDPTLIDEVAFTLDSAPPSGSTIKIKLVSAGSTWYTCSNVTTAVTCATTSPQATVSTADELRVVAVS